MMSVNLEILDEGIIWKNPYPSIRSVYAWHGHTENLGGGELIHAMRVGQAKSGVDCRCKMLRSLDHGKTWKETTPLIPEEEVESGFSFLTAFPRLDSKGRLWATSLKLRQIEPEDSRWTPDNGGWIGAEAFVCHSHDKGLTWSHAQVVGPEPSSRDHFPTLASPVIELDSGELMILFEAFFTQTMEKMHHQVSAMYSSDGGRTWGNQTLVAEDPKNRLIYFDPRITKLEDGRWLCLFWTHDSKTDETLNTTRAYSYDGHCWTSPEPTALWGFPTLPLTLPDGRLFAVYNYRRFPQGVRCALSSDGGRSWDMKQEYVLWDQESRQITGQLATAGRPREWEGSSMAEVFTWDFGVPDPA